MSVFRGRPAVTFLAVLLGTGGAAVGACLGGWLATIIKVLQYDNWSTLRRIPVDSWGLPNMPEWFGEEQKSSTDFLAFALSTVGLVVGVLLGLRLCRFLVVKRFAWITEKEADDFLKRTPDF